MTKIRLDLAYHGARFAGWAAQPGMRTVQGELEAPLERILGRAVQLTVAGRTDAGVHAWGQVASFETDVQIDGEPMRAVFIRAPWIEEVGNDVEVLAEVDGHPVAVRHCNVLAVAFHPELTGDDRLHRWLVDRAGERTPA